MDLEHFSTHIVIQLCAALHPWAMPTSFEAVPCDASLFWWHCSQCSFGKDVTKKLSLYLSSPVFSLTLTFATSLTWTSRSTGRSWSLLVSSYQPISLASLALNYWGGENPIILLLMFRMWRRWSSTLSLLASGLAILPCAWLTVS